MNSLESIEEYIARSTINRSQSHISREQDQEVTISEDSSLETCPTTSDLTTQRQDQNQNMGKSCKCLPIAADISLQITKRAKGMTFANTRHLLLAIIEMGLENICFNHLRYFAS